MNRYSKDFKNRNDDSGRRKVLKPGGAQYLWAMKIGKMIGGLCIFFLKNIKNSVNKAKTELNSAIEALVRVPQSIQFSISRASVHN